MLDLAVVALAEPVAVERSLQLQELLQSKRSTVTSHDRPKLCKASSIRRTCLKIKIDGHMFFVACDHQCFRC